MMMLYMVRLRYSLLMVVVIVVMYFDLSDLLLGPSFPVDFCHGGDDGHVGRYSSGLPVRGIMVPLPPL